MNSINFTNTIFDSSLREVINSFIDCLKDHGILYFAFLDKEYLSEEIPYNYPQYFMIIRERAAGSLIDEIFFMLQDKFGWPYGHYFVNSCSRKNIFCLKDLEEGLKVERVYLDFQDIDKILGNDISVIIKDDEYNFDELIINAFRNLRENLSNVAKILDIGSINSTIRAFEKAEPSRGLIGTSIAVSNNFCRLRGEGKTNDTNTTVKIKELLSQYISGTVDIPSKIHLYGRLNGCGKSQYIYNLMGFLYRNNYPFIMREVFYFHYTKYLEGENNREAFPYFSMLEGAEDDQNAATCWLKTVIKDIEGKTGKKPIIFADELDFLPDEFEDYFVISADKDITKYLEDDKWLIQDIIKNDFIDSSYVKASLAEELDRINVFNEVQGIDDDILKLIAESSIMPLYSNNRCSIYHAKRLFSLSLLEGVKRYLSGGEVRIISEDVIKWKDYYWNKFIPPSGIIDNFHCEYIIYDGRGFSIDPYVTFNPIDIIARNA